MKTNVYDEIKSKLKELNNINDEINLIEWNKDDGPKFSSVEEMKEFENRVVNGDFDYLLDNTDNEETNNNLLQTFNYTLNNFEFYIYTLKKNNDYIIYMDMKELSSDEILNNMYGKKCSTKEESNSYFEKLKNDITSNDIDYILENILIDITNNIKNLKIKHNELTNES